MGYIYLVKRYWNKRNEDTTLTAFYSKRRAIIDLKKRAKNYNLKNKPHEKFTYVHPSRDYTMYIEKLFVR
jgi:hypothetical protein